MTRFHRILAWLYRYERVLLTTSAIAVGAYLGVSGTLAFQQHADSELREAHAELDALNRVACRYLGAVRIGAQNDSTRKLWHLKGPTGISMDELKLTGGGT